MKKSGMRKPVATTTSLSEVLGHSEQIKAVVEECADELSSVNVVLKEGFADIDQQPEVEDAIEKSGEIEDKVQEAAEQLSVVNQALEHELREREMLEHQLVAVREQEESARHAAFHDPLTALPNRVLFNDRLEHGLAQAKRHGWTQAIMFLDLDDFKGINDLYGHDAGDLVLQTISKRLLENTRIDDTVSRHGGDELVYLLMEVEGKQDIVLIAEKIIKTIQQPCDIGICKLVINPSIGISVFPGDGELADILIKSADKAMYQAKRTKSGYAFAS
ncbi:MAG: GGDEF domain-containing protein [Candidatus Methylopumilus sp.]|jgi:diguanylate cyclase (GGDEF)-like protein